MRGLMMDKPLLISSLIRHAEDYHGDHGDRLAHGRRGRSTATPMREAAKRAPAALRTRSARWA